MSPVIIVPEPYSSTVRSSERQVTGTVAPIGRKSEIAKIEASWTTFLTVRGPFSLRARSGSARRL
jgi:hypothetical protein